MEKTLKDVTEFANKLRPFLIKHYPSGMRNALATAISEFSRGEEMILPSSYIDDFVGRPMQEAIEQGKKIKKPKNPVLGMKIISNYLHSQGYIVTEDKILYNSDPNYLERYRNTIEGRYVLIFDNGGEYNGARRFNPRQMIFPTDLTKYRKAGSYKRKHPDNAKLSTSPFEGKFVYQLYPSKPAYTTMQLSEEGVGKPIGSYFLKRLISEAENFEFWYGFGVGLSDLDGNLIIAAPAIMLPDASFKGIFPYFSICEISQNNTPMRPQIFTAIESIFDELCPRIENNRLIVGYSTLDKPFVDENINTDDEKKLVSLFSNLKKTIGQQNRI